MAFWKSSSGDSDLPKNDRGSGSLNNYAYDLIPRSRKTAIRLASSDARQDEIQRLLDDGASGLETAGGRRTVEEERTDAPLEVRLFTGGRVSGVVGVVPRGLESAIDEAMTRLERAGKKARIPAAVVKTRHGLRVELQMGATKSP
ncbi:hypothetical protein [Glaciibacter superstes]|uniref:hypothetical protein n=1 Tax=Glaciibacter superstes TaxID=501023 RepID=UPI0003B3B664|nr:hypothetical protein [Glaciibacter superstes]